ncbi:MAG: FAD-dependent oxidoreductase [Desulfurococcaceae archaeon]
MPEGISMKFAFLCRKAPPRIGKRVAVIGAGPAGLAITGYLACRGYDVDVYDKLPYPGGLMTFAIPRRRIPVEDVLEGCKDLEENFNVKFHLKTKVSAGKGFDEGDEFVESNIDLAELLESYDGVVVATGTWKSRRLGVENEDAKNVTTALGFLYHRRLKELKLAVETPLPSHGRVVVIGAGLSAVDAAEECLLAGAREVYVVYRRSIREAPAGAYRIRDLVKNGVNWIELAYPKRIIVEGNYAKGVEFVKVKLGEPDETGRPRPIPIPGSEFIIEADLIIKAVGEVPTPPIYSGDLAKYVDSSGRLIVESYRIPGTNVFAVGDVVTGPSKVGLAVDHALKASRIIDHALSGEKIALTHVLGKVEHVETPGIEKASWIDSVGENVCKYLETYGIVKSENCLKLPPFIRVFDYSKCIGCETCSAVCGFVHEGKSLIKINKTEDGLVFPTACLHCANAGCQAVCKRNAIVRGDLGEVLIDYKKCNRCMDCLIACPVRAMRLSRGEIINCDLCAPLRKVGLGPACMSMCPSKAIALMER